jgi:SAM-dependent methyltransferase
MIRALLSIPKETMPSIEEYYEQYWENPDDYVDPSTPARQALLRRFLQRVPAGTKIIDVGCGTGEFCDFFYGLGFHAEGSDLSHAAIAHARKTYKGKGLTFHTGEVHTLLPAHAGCYGVAFSSEVIEHLFDVANWLGAINQLLEPDGYLILTTPYHGFAKNLAIDLFGYSRHYDPLGQHIRFFDKAGLTRCLRLCGFEPLSWTGYGRPWPFWKSMFVVARKVRPCATLAFGTQGRLV